MSRNEMRTIRQNYINALIHENYFLHRYAKPIFRLQDIKNRVREFEYVNFGYEMRAYAGNWQDVT